MNGLHLKIGFLDLTVFDVLDILIVGWLLYSLLRLLRGSIAFNILFGIALVYGLWWIVDFFRMDVLSMLLGQFASLGVIAFLIVFQPEIRRFLLLLGRTLQTRYVLISNIFGRPWALSEDSEESIKQFEKALTALSRTHTGALIVFTPNPALQVFNASGTRIDARVSALLLESIFNKESPLHDGAVIIADNHIYTASCVLPVSENMNLPESAGLRHRAAVGVTEGTETFAVIVSEETGKLSYARDGSLYHQYSLEKIIAELKLLLQEH